jgi:hypothetical protein
MLTSRVMRDSATSAATSGQAGGLDRAMSTCGAAAGAALGEDAACGLAKVGRRFLCLLMIAVCVGP